MSNQSNITYDEPLQALCRQCFTQYQGLAAPLKRCEKCASTRLIQHPELFKLSIAHIDCDAFYASVEKRDNPALKARPVIIGGGARGVVATACYVARLSGVRSAMPMFQAKKLCPDAVIISSNMAKYVDVSRQVKKMMRDLTPLVEPLSLDEAFLDLSGTEQLHGGKPAMTLARLAAQIEQQVGISVSIGLAPNKFLAKLASDMDKPRGFTVIGQCDMLKTLAGMSIKRISGIGKKTAERLAKDGLTKISQVQEMEETVLFKRYGETGGRLWRLSRGIDNRPVDAKRPVKSVSAETTFLSDIADRDRLETILWRQCERVASDAKKKKLAGVTITLKLKTSVHRIITRSRTIDRPTQLSVILFETASQLMAALIDGTPYRLLGVGLSHFRPVEDADQADLIDTSRTKKRHTEQAIDALREKFGSDAVIKGRGFEAAKNTDKEFTSLKKPGK